MVLLEIFVESSAMDEVLRALASLPNTEELYEVTGKPDIICLISASGIDEFRDVLKDKIAKMHGIRSTVSSVILHTHKALRS